MTMKVAFLLLFLTSAAFSTEQKKQKKKRGCCFWKKRKSSSKYTEDLQGPKEKEYISLYYRQRSEDLQLMQKREELLRKREQNAKLTEGRLQAREKSLEDKEEKLKHFEISLYEWEKLLIARKIGIPSKVMRERETLKEKVRRKSKRREQLIKRLIARKVRSTFERRHFQWNKSKISWPLNLYPNESSVKVLRDMETNEISWEDPKNLIEMYKKQKIKLSLKQKGKSIVSNSLFDCISTWYWDVPADSEVEPFYKELLFSISENVDVDKKEADFNNTPLILAAYFDTKKTVIKLIERGAKTEAANREGSTALHFAAGLGNKSCCEALLQHEANVNCQNNCDWTPIMIAVKYRKDEVVKLLLESGADTKMKNKDGKTALDYADQNLGDVIRAQERKMNKSNEKI